MTLLPTTNAGERSGVLLAWAVAAWVLFGALVASGQRGGDTFFSNLWLTVPMLAAVVAAIASAGFGVVALRHRDRSVVVVIGIVVGAFVALFAAAELAFPH